MFPLTVGPIDKVGSLWRTPGLKEPEEEVFTGGDIQVSRILFNPRIADRRLLDPKSIGSEVRVGEQLDYGLWQSMHSRIVGVRC